MSIKLNEISSLIKEEIKDFKSKIDYANDVGTVVTVGDEIAIVYGLSKAMLGELLLFPNGVFGMAMNLEEDSVGVVMLGDDVEVKEGDIVKRTERWLRFRSEMNCSAESSIRSALRSTAVLR